MRKNNGLQIEPKQLPPGRNIDSISHATFPPRYGADCHGKAPSAGVNAYPRALVLILAGPAPKLQVYVYTIPALGLRYIYRTYVCLFGAPGSVVSKVQLQAL